MILPVMSCNFNTNYTYQKQLGTKSRVVTNYTSSENYSMAFKGIFGPSKRELALRAKEVLAKEAREAERVKLNHIYAEKSKRAAIESLKLQRESEYISNLADIKTNQITPLLLDLIIREGRGKLTEMPNCVMIACGTEGVNNDLVEWTKNNAGCRVVTMDSPNDIVTQLDNSEASYQETGMWTLMHVKNFADRIDPCKSEFETIESMKDIMSAASEDYHTTILFAAEHPEKLDEIALQSHRVEPITANLRTAKEINVEDARKRLEQYDIKIDEGLLYLDYKGCNYSKDYPVNAVKDLLYINDLEGKTYILNNGKQGTYNIDFSASKDDISSMYLAIKEGFFFPAMEKEISEYKNPVQIFDNLVYIPEDSMKFVDEAEKFVPGPYHTAFNGALELAQKVFKFEYAHLPYGAYRVSNLKKDVIFGPVHYKYYRDTWMKEIKSLDRYRSSGDMHGYWGREFRDMSLRCKQFMGLVTSKFKNAENLRVTSYYCGGLDYT